MKKDVKKAEELARELNGIFNALVERAKDLDLKRLLKQLEADYDGFQA